MHSDVLLCGGGRLSTKPVAMASRQRCTGLGLVPGRYRNWYSATFCRWHTKVYICRESIRQFATDSCVLSKRVACVHVTVPVGRQQPSGVSRSAALVGIKHC